ncbi:phosphoribosylformylglycinamidine synthase subunit PurL [Candidatus Sumerlaeota bacterium]|nr:phosphoribosylformylglycinamidine synthase subunit PurL [Candidatus Sumerlaeota bacterium]
MKAIAITPEIVAEHGLTPEEYEKLLEILGREPSITELGIFSVMWSEHCSYKNSRPVLKRFPTTGPQVLQGPGENAGVIDIGNGLACCFKIESHNHPSAVMPYAGAATGVGGILRDIFTMGARPVAMLNSLRFGMPDSPRMQHLIDGVIKGIADYGNCVGVPTVAGEVYYETCFEQNILVNAMCVGLMKHEELTLAQAEGAGNLIIYFGNATGRDGIHGATFASEELTDETIEQRSAVQVGDPFMGKKILEATLELIRENAVVGIQDMGAAGLTCSSCEMAGRAGTGVEIDLSKVPQRAENMSAYELMLSESQERMLAVCRPDQFEKAKAILEHWEVGCHVLGEVNDSGLLTVKHNGEVVAHVPADQISIEAPVYHREQSDAPWLGELRSWDEVDISGDDPQEQFIKLLSWPSIASKRWVYEQYDHMVQTNTMVRPGSDAAVIRVRGTNTALAMTTDCNSMLCFLNPEMGGRIAVAEAARNIVCSGAKPLGITDCLNFGNPMKPHVFRQFDRACTGISEACEVFNTPVTGGNVSFYNESKGLAVFPSPVIGMIGVAEDQAHVTTSCFKNEGDKIYLLGPGASHLGGSQYLRQRQHEAQKNGAAGANDALMSSWPIGPCPRIDLQLEKQVQDFLLAAIREGLIASAHDVTEGGLAVALAEACISGERKIGAKIGLNASGQELLIQLFSEEPSRIVVSVSSGQAKAFEAKAAAVRVSAMSLGEVGGDALEIQGAISMGLDAIVDQYDRKPF